MSRLRTKVQRDMLVFGYIKQNSVIAMPVDITKLCFEFYNDVIDWLLSDKTLHKFLNAKSGEKLLGPKFEICNIPFQLILYPNGVAKGYVSYFLEFIKDKLPTHIEDFSVFLNLFCSATLAEFQSPLTMKYIGNKLKHQIGWFKYNMKLEQCKNKNYKSINFGCYINPIHIQYKSSKTLLTYNSLLTKCEYKWNISDNTRNALKTASKGQCYYSPSFNSDCFGIVFIPKGRITDLSETVRIFVKLLKLPPNVSYVLIEYELNVCSENESDNMKYSSTAKLGYIKERSVASSTLTFVPSKFIFDRHLLIKAVVEIKCVFDKNGIAINNDMWSVYGFVDETPKNERELNSKLEFESKERIKLLKEKEEIEKKFKEKLKEGERERIKLENEKKEMEQQLNLLMKEKENKNKNGNDNNNGINFEDLMKEWNLGQYINILII
eukprot:177775_1